VSPKATEGASAQIAKLTIVAGWSWGFQTETPPTSCTNISGTLQSADGGELRGPRFAQSLRRRLSLPEGLLWRAIKGGKAEGLKFRKQHPIGPHVLDFYCHEVRLCVEIDGASHGFGNRLQLDARRDAWLAARDIRTLRISASLVLDEVDDAVRMIVDAARGGAGPV
jgi:very-short-patch-repair endonuclease